MTAYLLAALTCLICGHETADRRAVEVHLARFREPVEGRLFATIPRCLDFAACRARCEANGEAWPLDDGTPRPVTETRPAPAPSRTEEDAPWG
jgi:hypothetical protein